MEPQIRLFPAALSPVTAEIIRKFATFSLLPSFVACIQIRQELARKLRFSLPLALF